MSKITCPRRARPAEIVVERCHACSVRRSWGVRRMVREVRRPRAIPIPRKQETFLLVSAGWSGNLIDRFGKNTCVVECKNTGSVYCACIPISLSHGTIEIDAWFLCLNNANGSVCCSHPLAPLYWTSGGI